MQEIVSSSKRPISVGLTFNYNISFIMSVEMINDYLHQQPQTFSKKRCQSKVLINITKSICDLVMPITVSITQGRY